MGLEKRWICLSDWAHSTHKSTWTSQLSKARAMVLISFCPQCDQGLLPKFGFSCIFELFGYWSHCDPSPWNPNPRMREDKYCALVLRVWDHHHQNPCLGLAMNGSVWVPIKLSCYGPATEHIIGIVVLPTCNPSYPHSDGISQFIFLIEQWRLFPWSLRKLS